MTFSRRNKKAKGFFSANFKKFDFIGWIPNTTGHVYFRHAEVKQGEIDRYTVRPFPFLKDDENIHRYILATSLCDLNDLPPNESKIKLTRFIVNAESINKRELKGSLWMIWNVADNPGIPERLEQRVISLFASLKIQSDILRKFWSVETTEGIPHTGSDKYRQLEENAKLDDRYKEVCQAIQLFELSKDELNSDLNYIIETWKSLDSKKGKEEFLRSLGIWASYIEFTVSNTGFCYLKHHSLSKEDSKEDDGVQVKTEIAYYYLKYLLHEHSHHDSRVDSFCRLHRIPRTPLNGSILANEIKVDPAIELSRKLLRDIKVNLINIKFDRTEDESFVRNAKGLAAYGSSLVQQLKAEKILNIGVQEHADFVIRESVYIDKLIQSIDIKHQEKLATSWAKTFHLTSHVFAFLLLLFGSLILFGVELAAQPSIPHSHDKPINCHETVATSSDLIGKYIAHITCESGISGLFAVYITVLACTLVLVRAYLYIKETGKVDKFLLTKYIETIFRGFRPVKVTAPREIFSSYASLTPANFKNTLLRVLRFLWYGLSYKADKWRCRLSYFTLYKLPSVLSSTYYWKVNAGYKVYFSLILGIILFPITIFLIGVGILSAFESMLENEYVFRVFIRRMSELISLIK